MSEQPPQNGASVLLRLDQHDRGILDHETRLRTIERWVSEHGSWDREHHARNAEIASRVTTALEKVESAQNDASKEVANVWVEVGKMKVRLSMMMALAGSIGGIIAAVLTAIALKLLGV